MKNFHFLSFALFAFLLVSCSDNQEPEINSNLPGTWILTNMSGGIAGVNCIYEEGEITWVFDDQTTLNIERVAINMEPLCATVAGTDNHQYGVLTHNNKKYLLLDGSERGEIIVTDTTLSLDQNKTSEGSGADGFQIVFERK